MQLEVSGNIRRLSLINLQFAQSVICLKGIGSGVSVGELDS